MWERERINNVLVDTIWAFYCPKNKYVKKYTVEIGFHAVPWNFSVATLDLENKDSFDVNLEKGFICWVGHPMVHRGPTFYKFIKNILVATFLWGFFPHSVYWEEPQTELSPSHTMRWLFMTSESTTAGKPWF